MSKRLDGGYGWLIVTGCFMVTVCVLGTGKVFGVLFVHIRSEYNSTYTATASIQLVQKFCETGTALIFSFLAESFGSRPVMLIGATFLVGGTVASFFVRNIFQLTFTYGVVVGLGMAMLFSPAFQMLPKYFEKRLAIASAFAYTGASIGPLVFPLLITFAIEEFGLSGSFIVLAAVFLHVYIAAMLLWPPEHWNSVLEISKDANEKSDDNDDDLDVVDETVNNHSCNKMLHRYLSCLRNRNLLLYYFSHYAKVVASFCFINYQQAHIQDLGIVHPQLQAWLTSIWGLAEIPSRCIFGLVLQSGIIQPYRLCQVAALVMVVLFAIYPLLTSYWAVAATSAAVSFCFSSAVVAMIPSVRLVVGMDLSSPGVGLFCLPILLGYVTVQLGSVVRDLAHTFSYIYYGCCVFLVLDIVALEILACNIKTSVFSNPTFCHRTTSK